MAFSRQLFRKISILDFWQDFEYAYAMDQDIAQKFHRSQDWRFLYICSILNNYK